MTISKSILLVSYTIAFSIFIPIISLLFFVPNILFRCFVLRLKRFIRKDLGNMVSPLSNMFSVDAVYKAPTANLVLGSVYHGTLSKELVCQIVVEKWLNKRSANGELFYPELRQSITTWLGYMFWKNENGFDINDHVRYLANNRSSLNTFSANDLQAVFVKTVNEPFVKNRSPWEIIIIPNYQCDTNSTDGNQERTLVLFKIHHSLADGFSVLNLGQRDLADIPPNSLKQTENRHQDYYRRCSVWIWKCGAMLQMPYFLAKMIVETGFSTTPYSNTVNRKQVVAFTYRRMSLGNLKALRSKYGVCLTSVLLAGLTAAVRKCLSSDREESALLETAKVCCVVPTRLEGHPDKLRNHMSFAHVNLPIYEDCAKTRLMMLNNSLVLSNNTFDPFSMYYMLYLVGMLPNIVVKWFVRNTKPCYLLSNFPGLASPFYIKGHRCSELFFNGGLLQGNIHMVFSCVGYQEEVAITLAADEYTMNSGISIDEIMQTIVREIYDLLDAE